MWFADDFSWKLVNLSSALPTGESTVQPNACRYTCPDITQSLERGHGSVCAKPSMDMWSFGLLAFEVLTSKPCSGRSPLQVASSNTRFPHHRCGRDSRPDREAVGTEACLCRENRQEVAVGQPQRTHRRRHRAAEPSLRRIAAAERSGEEENGDGGSGGRPLPIGDRRVPESRRRGRGRCCSFGRMTSESRSS